MPRDPDLEELRFRCLELAVRMARGDTVQEAAAFYAFVMGQDTKTPRERILDALEAADVR